MSSNPAHENLYEDLFALGNGAARVTQWAPGEPEASGAANRLLIVDDEPGIIRIIEAAARELGFEVLAIHDTDRFERLWIKSTRRSSSSTLPCRDATGWS
jgi:hypothetical protein